MCVLFEQLSRLKAERYHTQIQLRCRPRLLLQPLQRTALLQQPPAPTNTTTLFVMNSREGKERKRASRVECLVQRRIEMCPDHHSHQFLSNNNKFYHHNNNVFHLPQVMNSSASSVTSTSSIEYLKNNLDSGDGGQLSAGTLNGQKIPGSVVQTQSLPSSRYKTELCRPFEEFGTCKYGDKCQFAHGSQELRRMVRHPKYKTELCRTFHTHGLCPYGHRCHFIHNDDNLITDEPPSAGGTKAEMRRSVSSSGVSSSSSLSPSPPLSSSPTGSLDNSVFPIANNNFSPRLPIFSSFFAGAVSSNNSNHPFNNNSVQQAFAHVNA